MRKLNIKRPLIRTLHKHVTRAERNEEQKRRARRGTFKGYGGGISEAYTLCSYVQADEDINHTENKSVTDK